MSGYEGPHEYDVDDEESATNRYRANKARCKMILVQAFGAGNPVLEEYFREVDHGGSCSWNDYEEMSAEDIEGDFIMYRETRGHGTPNFT